MGQKGRNLCSLHSLGMFDSCSLAGTSNNTLCENGRDPCLSNNLVEERGHEAIATTLVSSAVIPL